MKMEERDEIVQVLMQLRKKVSDLERDFKETIEMVDTYKIMLINIRIDELEKKKKEGWLHKWI